MTHENEQLSLTALKDYGQRFKATLDQLRAELPDVPAVTLVVMANDRLAAEIATRAVEGGAPPERLLWQVGSYARVDWAINHLPRRRLLEIWPKLWRDSDPDDTNLRYLQIWREVRAARRGIVLDQEGPHPFKKRLVKLYRGQRQTDLLGFSWTTDKNVAYRFACGAGFRAPISDGCVLEVEVASSTVLAYLRERREAEAIVDLEADGCREIMAGLRLGGGAR